MVELEQLRPGMKVRIADRWDAGVPTPPPSMRKWFGQTIAVSDVDENYVVMEDNGKNYYWLTCDIDCIVSETAVEFDEAEFLSLFS